MAISIKRSNIAVLGENEKLCTKQYGNLPIVESVDLSNHLLFDTIEGYDLFISDDANKLVAIESKLLKENLDKNNIEQEIEKLKSNYPELDKVEYIESDNAIIIKSSEDNSNILDEIAEQYSNDTNFKANKVTSTVLFLDIIDPEIQLEDDDLLNKLDDQAIKDLASKTGTKLNGNETKDELKGIIKGSLTNNTNN